MPEEILEKRPKTRPAWEVYIGVILGALLFGAIGYLAGSKSSDTVTDSVTDTTERATATAISSTSTTATVSAASSNIYKNSDFGFSFTLPTGYFIQETQLYEGARGVKLSFGKNKTTTVSDSNYVELQYLQDNSSLASIDKSFNGEFSSDLSDRKEIIIDGHPGISYMIGGLASGKTILATNGSASLKISVYPDNDDTRAFADNIASTFKF